MFTYLLATGFALLLALLLGTVKDLCREKIAVKKGSIKMGLLTLGLVLCFFAL